MKLNNLLSIFFGDNGVVSIICHARRYIRSFARLFVLLTMESLPSPSNIFNQTTSNLVSSNYLKFRKQQKATTTSSLLSNTPISNCEHIKTI